MKQKFQLSVVFVSLFLCLFMSRGAYGQYIAKRVTISTAEVVIGGSAVSNMSITIRNRLTHAITSKIQWTNVYWGLTSWKIANQYADIDFSCSAAKWYMVLKTDNTNRQIAKPRYKGGINDADGLIHTATSNQSLELVWQIQADTSSYQPPRINPPIDMGAGVYKFTNTGWTWKWTANHNQSSYLSITANTNMANGPTVSSLPVSYYSVPVCKGVNQGVINPAGANDGRLWGSGSWERGDGISSGNRYVYWAANFGPAEMATYKTTALKLELVIQ
ncbi:MAG: hypothetical protein PHF84_07560 [bacterium]|nr:hypothetical protein [bacterium]